MTATPGPEGRVVPAPEPVEVEADARAQRVVAAARAWVEFRWRAARFPAAPFDRRDAELAAATSEALAALDGER